jgi:hypothetical protein
VALNIAPSGAFAMVDLPIIFSAPMVTALLGGRKTQTRRMAWRTETWAPALASERLEDFELRGWDCRQVDDGWQIRQPSPWQKVKPGDRLWCRENWQALSFGDYLPTTSQPADVRYAATDPLADDDKDVRGYPWRPSIHMPRWASRLTLIVEAVKVEPLQDIGWNDAIAEGIERGDPMPEVPNSHGTIWHNGMTDPLHGWTRDPTHAFRDLWIAIHGPESWGANPEVVAISFKVIKENIDRIKEAA